MEREPLLQMMVRGLQLWLLEAWWSCALRSLQSGGDEGACELVRERYEEISMRIYKAMIESYDEAEARASAAEDWAQDAHGEPSMRRDRFMDAFFELADVWTRSMEPTDYADFLRTLFARVTRAVRPARAVAVPSACVVAWPWSGA